MCVDASGGMAVQGMYQVVQRFEHISTTTAVVPRYPTAPAATATDQVGEKPISSFQPKVGQESFRVIFPLV